MPNGDGSGLPDGRTRRRFSPAARHLALLALFYIALAIGIGALQRAYPGATNPISGLPKGLVTVQGIIRAITAMLGALALALPLAWVFVITRRRKGFSQSIVHTLIILPIAVAGIMVVVQNSLALAFGLAGIAALRFRNTLDDTKDAIYLFVATGIGIAAAADQFGVGLALSFLFNVTIIVLWWTNYGRTPARLKARLLLRQLRQTREARIPGVPGAATDPLNTLLRVHVLNPDAAQSTVAAVLGRATKQWELTGVTPGTNGFSTLDYVVRLRTRTVRGELLNDLRASGRPDVVGAEFR
jgi:uncharacterized protein DUF4956